MGAMGAQRMVDLEKLSIEERSNVEERKLTILKDYQQYMGDHPELRQVLNDFTCAVLTDKPKNIYKFARYWFSMSLPPLDPMSTAGTLRKTPAPVEETQTLEHIARVSTYRLLARVYATIDSDCDTTCTKKEFECSPLYGVWPEVIWQRMDADANGSVTPTEFFSFMRSVEADEGKAKFHERVTKFVWEADIDVMDLLPPSNAAELKKAVAAVDPAKLQAYLFKAAIHQGTSSEERNFIYRKEMQHSKIGQLMLPFWGQLDADENVKVSHAEWDAFFEKASSSELGQEMAANGENILVDLFINGGYDINDVA